MDNKGKTEGKNKERAASKEGQEGRKENNQQTRERLETKVDMSFIF